MAKSGKKKVAATVVVSTMLLSGCGMFGGEKTAKEVDPPQDVSYLEEEDKSEKESNVESSQEDTKSEKKEEQAAETVKRELYLIDSKGLVVAQTVDLPKQDGAAKQVVEYLVEGGPISNMLPDGFRAVLPADTEVKGVSIKDGTATVDFSKEFEDYKPEDEQKILQAVTWTLTQFDSVKNVKFWINGHELNEMPVGGTPISDELNRETGINYDTSDVIDITNSHPVTVYYLAENEDKSYYVPVTKRVSNKEEDPIVSAVNELIEGPANRSGLLSGFQSEVELLSAPKNEDGKVTLDFNEAIYGAFDEDKKVISKHVLNSLVLTLTAQEGVESVAVTVNGKADLVNEDGKKLSEPVTRTDIVNTGSF
ncbi:GerMN domain-containing protein [Metabacillus arenae]|uniref:GerMN domain-containing protein n=1 Tax=Metabacillus arenae TaxID=2771434 RepID=A0A926NH29_9BACI|nr:GerMN domain-containing protein [Metabacillus arenae]MBD1381161.1 GerMN domain-containing protein [Metabacillus arenae]